MRTYKSYFVLLSVLTGFFLGMLYSLWIVPEGSSLAGPGNLFWNVTIGVLLCLGLSLLVQNRIGEGRIIKLNILLFFLNLIPISWLVFRIFMLDPAPRSDLGDAPDQNRLVEPAVEKTIVPIPGTSFSDKTPVFLFKDSAPLQKKYLKELDSANGRALP